MSDNSNTKSLDDELESMGPGNIPEDAVKDSEGEQTK